MQMFAHQEEVNAVGKKKDRFMRLREVMTRTAPSRSMIYALMDQERFPRSAKISERSIAWLESEIESWIEDKVYIHQFKKMSRLKCVCSPVLLNRFPNVSRRFPVH